MASAKRLEVAPPASKTPTSQQKTAVPPQEIDFEAIRKAIKLTTKEKMFLFERMAAQLDAGTTINEFFEDEVKRYDLMKGKSVSRLQFLLGGRPSKGAETFVRSFSDLMITQGLSFAGTAENYPGVFDQLLLGCIRAGERHGDYADFLRRWCQRTREQRETIENLITAAIYPSIIVTVATGVTTTFLLVIAPAFAQIYEGLLGNQELPGMTQFVLNLSDFLKKHYLSLGIATFGGVTGYVLGRKYVPSVVDREHSLLLRTPIIGEMIAEIDMYNFLQTFIMLKEAGEPLLGCAEFAAEAISNRELRNAVLRAADRFHHQERCTFLHQALAEEHLAFSPGSQFYSEMRAVEKTANIDSIRKFATYLKNSADKKRVRLEKMLEPAAIILLGVLIGFLVAALYMPIFTLIGKFAGRLGGGAQ